MIKADFRRSAAAGGEPHTQGSGTDGHAAHKAAPAGIVPVLTYDSLVVAEGVQAAVQKVFHEALAREYWIRHCGALA
jgi:hypothetical protein